MYIDINTGRLYIEIEEERHLFTLGNDFSISLGYSLCKVGMAHITSIHKEVLERTFLAGTFGSSDKTLYVYHRTDHIHLYKLRIDFFTKEVYNALAERRRRQRYQFISIMRQRKFHTAVDKGHTLQLSNNIIELSLHGLEKLSTCRNVEKEVLHLEITADRSHDRFLCLQF